MYKNDYYIICDLIEPLGRYWSNSIFTNFVCLKNNSVAKTNKLKFDWCIELKNKNVCKYSYIFSQLKIDTI